MFTLLVLAAVLIALFCTQQKSEAEVAARKGGLFKTDMAPSYEAKIVKPDLRRPSTLGRLV